MLCVLLSVARVSGIIGSPVHANSDGHNCNEKLEIFGYILMERKCTASICYHLAVLHSRHACQPKTSCARLLKIANRPASNLHTRFICFIKYSPFSMGLTSKNSPILPVKGGSGF